MEINTNILEGIRIFTALLIILVAVLIFVVKYRQRRLPNNRTHPRWHTLAVSTILLNAIVQLPGRTLAGADGREVVLNLVAAVALLVSLNIMFWVWPKPTLTTFNSDADNQP